MHATKLICATCVASDFTKLAKGNSTMVVSHTRAGSISGKHKGQIRDKTSQNSEKDKGQN